MKDMMIDQYNVIMHDKLLSIILNKMWLRHDEHPADAHD